jgi:FixJ family two-component response regulator
MTVIGAHRVFVIDDDASVRTGLARLLCSAGFRVETFESGRAYLERCAFAGVGCVVLDLRMPELDGMAVQALLDERGDDLPIIFLTGHGDIPITVQAMKLGAADFLTKPVDEGRLFAAVRDALQRHRRRVEERGDAEEARRLLGELTTRELEVVRCVLAGARNKQIAVDLGISEKTVKAHRASVMAKLGVATPAELGRLCALAGVEPREAAG